jgi:hypothetical protein
MPSKPTSATQPADDGDRRPGSIPIATITLHSSTSRIEPTVRKVGRSASRTLDRVGRTGTRPR